MKANNDLLNSFFLNNHIKKSNNCFNLTPEEVQHAMTKIYIFFILNYSFIFTLKHVITNLITKLFCQ